MLHSLKNSNYAVGCPFCSVIAVSSVSSDNIDGIATTDAKNKPKGHCNRINFSLAGGKGGAEIGKKVVRKNSAKLIEVKGTFFRQP